MHATVIEFLQKTLNADNVAGKAVLEVGSRDVNGTARDVVVRLNPSKYVGVDKTEGRGVDVVITAENLVGKFGFAKFDIVISTETLEHTLNWQSAVHNLKMVLKSGGLLVLTTRSVGMPPHELPDDFWRFSVADMKKIFGDLENVEVVQDRDPERPGVFVSARKPEEFTESDLSEHTVFAIGKPKEAGVAVLTDVQIAVWKAWPDLQSSFPAAETNPLARVKYLQWWDSYFQGEKDVRLSKV